ncbi:hypothetical protein [Crocosphaera sp. XPORK-15E]|uniref:hypothetical protein n=1 Tax=Crocosphaera sp. XPORK-15E TaxID=3110247 RepID=UPI002B215999|nr:hypothetical protein [Crocosphaera sp. XPORK-15E]MEA5535838.1 hypothetical protein [Crocosphaera sp. XPORK-15E]
MKDLFSIERIKEINQVMNEELKLDYFLSPKVDKLELEENFKMPPLPILIPYQSQLILNQQLLQKVIERIVRAYIELQPNIEPEKLLNRDYLRGVIRLSYSELESSEINLALGMKEIGRMIRDLGELDNQEYQEMADGNIVFAIHNYSRFIHNIRENRVSDKLQKQIEDKCFYIDQYLTKFPMFSKVNH